MSEGRAQPTGEEVIARIRAEQGPRTMLGFSRGKDALAAWIAMRPHFDDIVPYHLYLVPGLSFVEESLDYYERKFGRRIISLPHPTLYRWLTNFQFQSPSNARVIAAAGLPKFGYADIYKLVRQIEGLPDGTLAATGVRAADSPDRRVSLMSHGPISWNAEQYYPIWDWNKERLMGEIEKSGIGLPADYDLFGRSFDGLDLRFVYPLKQKRPDDYRRILEWFPLVEMEVWRYERYGVAA